MSKLDYEAVEDLLRHAAPRPAPDGADIAAAKAAVRRAWHEVSRRRVARRRNMALAVAASIAIVAIAAYDLLRSPLAEPVQVADIRKNFGAVYLLGERAELRPTVDLAIVLAGQTIVTSGESGLALGWGKGGSLRVDENTRIRLTSDTTVFLEQGRVYFDSSPGLAANAAAGAAPAFVLETAQGTVRHLGTQYMVSVADGGLVVSVREGEVAIDGRYYDQRVSSGQQATLSGSRRPDLLSLAVSGDSWDWVARTTPAADVDGKTLYEFLAWASREMGLEMRFEGQAEAIARAAILRGTIDTTPSEALRLRLATAALDWHIEQGVIYISN